jgi:hypothetical protein
MLHPMISILFIVEWVKFLRGIDRLEMDNNMKRPWPFPAAEKIPTVPQRRQEKT